MIFIKRIFFTATSFLFLLTIALYSTSNANPSSLVFSYTIVELNGRAPVALGRFHAPPVWVGDKVSGSSVMGNSPRERWHQYLQNASLGSSEAVLGQLGDSSLAIPMRAFFYRSGRFTDLGSLPGGTQSESRAINHKGEVVGWSAVSQTRPLNHAFLYANGHLIDLNACIAAHSGWILRSAEAINDFGQISGTGVYHGRMQTFLLTPTHLSAQQTEQLRQQMDAKKQADDEKQRPKSSLERLGPIAAHILDGALRVETFRVELPKETESNTHALLEGTVITATGTVLGETAASQISAVLRDPKPYLVISQPPCLMRPAVIFRIWKEKSYVDVVICFHCGQMVIRGYNDSGSCVSDMYGLMTAEETHTFSALAKQAFPQDTVIQALSQ